MYLYVLFDADTRRALHVLFGVGTQRHALYCISVLFGVEMEHVSGTSVATRMETSVLIKVVEER